MPGEMRSRTRVRRVQRTELRARLYFWLKIWRKTMFRHFIVATVLMGFTFTGVGLAPLHAQTPHPRQHSFSGAQHWARVFDDPARDEWQKPHEVIQALNLAPDAVVADIGSGTGYFSIRLAHFVPKGRVFGGDIEPDMGKYLAERAKREGLTNVTAVA